MRLQEESVSQSHLYSCPRPCCCFDSHICDSFCLNFNSCLRKYCDCQAIGEHCTDDCNCTDCGNVPGATWNGYNYEVLHTDGSSNADADATGIGDPSQFANAEYEAVSYYYGAE